MPVHDSTEETVKGLSGNPIILTLQGGCIVVVAIIVDVINTKV